MCRMLYGHNRKPRSYSILSNISLEIGSKYSVHPNLVSQWKKQLLESLPQIFSDPRFKQDHDHEQLEAQLYQQIGQLKVELDWLKKKVGLLS
jgi:putative transposase